MKRALWLIVAAAACGSQGGSSSQEAEEAMEFVCKERRAAYIVVGGFAGPEVGVVLDCAEKGPRISKWIVLDDEGNKKTLEHSVPPEQFNTIWEKVESTGWRNLKDCVNPKAQKGDPVYTIGIKDDSFSVSLRCPGRALPFPYDRLINELDLVVAQYGE